MSSTSVPPVRQPLISAEALRQALSQPDGTDLLILDARFNLANTPAGEAAWQQGHIAGAWYAHLDRDLSGAKTGRNGRHPLPSPDALQATLRRWGITSQTHVVAYDDAGGMFAARLWWLLRWAGHDAAQVLDGGWQAWQAAQGPVDTALAPRQASDFTPSWQRDWVVTADTVLSLLDKPSAQWLLDARAPDRFRGENETMDPVGGHIPGAHNRFFQLNLQSVNGPFKPATTLRSEFDTMLGTSDPQSITHQCGSGVTACHNILAMAHAGLPITRLYAGSWSEWCADPARPIAR